MLEEIKTYPIDLGKDYQTNETTFKNILNDIKEMYPLYRQTKVIDNISIKEYGEIKIIDRKRITLTGVRKLISFNNKDDRLVNIMKNYFQMETNLEIM